MLAAFNRRVQFAYRRINRCSDGFCTGVSGQLNRRNQPVFKLYASDRPVLKKIAGPTCHISLGRGLCSLSLFFSPPPLRSRTRLARAAAVPPRRRRKPPLQASAAAVRRPRTPAPPPCAARAPSAPPRAHNRHRAAPPPPAPHHCRHQRAAPPLRTQAKQTKPHRPHSASSPHAKPYSRIHASHAKCSVICPNHRARPRSQRRVLVAPSCRDGS